MGNLLSSSIPSAFTTLQGVTSTQLNNATITPFNAIVSAWTSYTPTFSIGGNVPTVGNGSIVGLYQQIGKTVWFRSRLAGGSTMTWTAPASWTALTVSLPQSIQATGGVYAWTIGVAEFADTTGNIRCAWTRVPNASQNTVNIVNSAGTALTFSTGTANDPPFQWNLGTGTFRIGGAGSYIQLAGCYECQ